MTTVTLSGTGVVVVGRVVPVVVLAVVAVVVVGPDVVVVDGHVGPVMVVSGDVVVDQGDVVESPLQTDTGGVKGPETHVSQCASSSHEENRKHISVCQEKYPH